MRHVYFSSQAQADAFVQDLLGQGLVRPELGRQQLSQAEQRELDQLDAASMAAPGASVAGEPHEASAEEIGLGAVRGTNAGLITGAVAGTVAALATGGLAAIPIMLGMAAVGGGVGAGVGAIGSAAGVDEVGADGLSDDRRTQLQGRVAGGGQLLAIEDAIPDDAVRAALARHGGELV